MKKSPLLLLITLMLLAGLQSAFASELKGGESVNITQAVNENLYAAGGNVNVDATIDGDLIAAGGELILNGTIQEDALLAGGSIIVNEVVEKDLRILGGSLQIFNNVKGDLVVTGGEIYISDVVTIHGDLIVAGGEVKMRGRVKGKTQIIGGEIDFKGIAEGEVSFQGGDLEIGGEFMGPVKMIAHDLEIYSNSSFHKDVLYYNRDGEIAFEDYLQEGATATYDETLKPDSDISEWKHEWKHGLKQVSRGFFAYRVLSSMLLITLLLTLFGGFFAKASSSLQRNYANNIGLGLGYVFLVPVIMFLAGITIIGLPVSFILGSAYGISIALGHVLAAIFVAFEWQFLSGRTLSKGQTILASIGAYLGLKVLSAIPVMGGIAAIAITLMALGTLVQHWRDSRKMGEEVLVEEDDIL